MYLEKTATQSFLVTKLYGRKVKTSCEFGVVTKDCLNKLLESIVSYELMQDALHAFQDILYTDQHLRYILYKNTFLQLLLDAKKSDLSLDNEIQDISTICATYFYDWRLTDFVFHSNKIEGSKVPYEQVKLLMTTGDSPYALTQERNEVMNSQEAWKFMQETFSFNQSKIKQLYHILTKNLLREDGYSYPTGYKKEPNVVGNSVTTAPECVEGAMQQLLNDYKKLKKTCFPIQLALDMHVRFERIHPFKDGNGRTGRMLMNKVLIQQGFLPFIVFSENRQAYFNVFEKDIKKYYSFMLEQYVKTLKQVPIDIII